MRLLVVAKAPVPGRVKTRLGADIGMPEAASIAAASLYDTLMACNRTTADERVLSLAGDLAEAVDGADLLEAVEGWRIVPQRGDSFAERLVLAHLDAGEGLTVQIGMDTPQVTPDLLEDAADAATDHDVALGLAADGGWWVLARHDTQAVEALREVPTSTDTTGLDTVSALRAVGRSVAPTDAIPVLRDVDTVADADEVASACAADADSRFARRWASSSGVTP